MYHEILSDVLVFKTNVDNPSAVEQVGQVLRHIHAIVKWNIDVQDVDHVLRIQCTDELSPVIIIHLLRSAGFECEELTD